MGYKRRTPGSRRDRRRTGRFQRTQRRFSQGADRAFLLIAGLFLLVVLILLAALALLSNR